ncbi:MAG: hypothetical protein ACRC4M_02960 [Mycoplasma sp.]
MLYYSKKTLINFVYYDEITSILLIQYRYGDERKYYKLLPDLFYGSVLPEIKKDNDFRGIILWAVRAEKAVELSSDNWELPEIQERLRKGI